MRDIRSTIVGLCALLGLCGVASAQESSVFDLITECDLLAAHPADPQRMADGVVDDEIVPRLAITACQAALKKAPNDPRHSFHMGRAQLALGRRAEAKTYFDAAAKQKYAAAFAYLGDMYQFGLGVQANAATALDYYKKALQGEFQPAEDQIKQLTFDPSLFVSSAIAELYNRTFDIGATAKEPLLRNYVFNVVLNTMEECGSYLKPGSLARFYLFRYPKGSWSAEQEEDIMVMIQTSVGEFDAKTFLERYGCNGPVAKRVFANMDHYFGSFKP